MDRIFVCVSPRPKGGGGGGHICYIFQPVDLQLGTSVEEVKLTGQALFEFLNVTGWRCFIEKWEDHAILFIFFFSSFICFHSQGGWLFQ